MKNIKFIVQGPYHPGYIEVLESIKKHYPNSKTYCSATERLPPISTDLVDTRFKCRDPGALDNDNNININRHKVTTRQGLLFCNDDDIIVKMRSDMIVRKGGCVERYYELIEEMDLTTGEWNIFDQRVAVSSVYTVNPRGPLGLCYHPGDWFMIGTKKDLLLMFGFPLMPQPEEATYQRYRCEQYMWICALNKRFPEIDIERDTQNTYNHIEQTELSFLDNLCVMDVEKYFHNIKYPKIRANPSVFMNEEYFNNFYRSFFR